MRKSKALVAEDETVVRRLCGRILEGLGYQTVMASHGLEALRAVEGESFEVVITDLRMPDLDGIQLLKAIKRNSPETDVIVITGYASVENAIEALKEGAADYLRKPFSADELQMVIQKCESKRRLAEEKSNLQEMVGIYELSTTLSSTISLGDIMGLFLDLTTRILRSSKALLFLLESSSGMLYVAGCKGLPEQEYKGLRIGLGETSLARALAREKPSLVEDLAGDPLLSKLSQNGKTTKGLLCAPLVARGKITGGLLLYPRESGSAFGPNDERVLSIMACQAAVAIENAQLLESHQRRIVELTKINEITRFLESRPDEPTFFSSLAQSLEGLVDYHICAFLVPSPEGGKLTIFASLPLTEGVKQELKEKMVQELGKHSNGKAGMRELEVTLSPQGLSPTTPPLAHLGATLVLPLTIKEDQNGVIAFVRAKEEPFDPVSLKAIHIITRIISLALENRKVYRGIPNEYLAVVRALSAVLEAKDPSTRDHSFYTAKYAKSLALRLGLAQVEVDKIIVAALLHDIGKVGISEFILGKTERLSPEEYQSMKRHPAIGARILESVDFPWDLKPLVLSHHEHFDGNGYPSGLKGEEIPLGSRILTIAEAYEMMIAGRPYQKALTRSEAAQELMKCAGTHFDPQLIPFFLETLAEKGEE